MKSSSGKRAARWSLVTNHGYVLACITAQPDARLRDIAATVGITERTTAHIVGDLERGGYLTKTRTGRRNSYQLQATTTIGTSHLPAITIGQLLGLLMQTREQQPLA